MYCRAYELNYRVQHEFVVTPFVAAGVDDFRVFFLDIYSGYERFIHICLDIETKIQVAVKKFDELRVFRQIRYDAVGEDYYFLFNRKLRIGLNGNLKIIYRFDKKTFRFTGDKVIDYVLFVFEVK